MNNSICELGESIPDEMGSIGDTSNASDLYKLSICNETDQPMKYYFEFYPDDSYNDNAMKCSRVVEIPNCWTCCDESSILFDVIGPDEDCCYRFVHAQDRHNGYCDSITNFSVTQVGDSVPVKTGLVNDPFGLPVYKLCNDEDSTIIYTFDFYKDGTYSDTSKVCSRTYAFDPCIDTTAACCKGLNIDIALEKGGDSCGSEQCAVEVIWDLPDDNYECYQLYINADGDTLNFDTDSFPTLVSESCIDVGTYIEGSVTLLRFPEDPNPCVANYEAYCPAGDLRQGCNPDSCDNIWYNGFLQDTIRSGACTNCVLNITYKHRNSCDNWQDLQILEIEKDCPDSVNCTSPTDSIYQEAVKMVINQNDMHFDPDWDKIRFESGDTCSIQWRISQISCWTDWMYDPMTPIIEKDKKPKSQSEPGGDPIELPRLITIYEPCNDVCCARQLEVCRYGADSVSIRDLGSLSEGEECDTVYWNNHECYDVCDFLEDFDQLDTLPKTPPIIYPKEDEITENGYANSSIYNSIVVSYTNQYLKVAIDNLNANYTELSLFSITGSLLTSESIYLQKGINIFKLDISRIQTGVYFYQISIDGLESQIGKIFLIR